MFDREAIELEFDMLMTPGTRFRGNEDNDANGICIVEAQPTDSRGSYIGPEWVWARPEVPMATSTQGLIFHIDEIGEIL
jgi:hypothetical protein